MTDTSQELTEAYAAALQEYLTEPREAGLMHAYDLGRRTLTLAGSVADLGSAHAQALGAALASVATAEEQARLTRRAAVFLAETMAPFEMLQRSYREANEQLQHLNATLEQRVEERTAALRESEERFRLLANTVPAFVWTAAPDGTITFASDRWYTYTGLTAEQNARDWPCSALHPDDCQRCIEQWTTALREGVEYQIEVRSRRHDGEYRWWITRATPIKGTDGRVAAWFGSSTDIHDLKLAQQALQDSDRRKDDFMAVLSHELRNPLAPIRNALQMLRFSKSTDEDLVEAREVIDRQVQQLAAIVDDLLDVFRIAHQKIHLQKVPLDLAQLVRQTVEDYRSALERSRLNLTVEAPGEPIWVHGDRRRLCQVVTNLLSNADKYSNPGDQIAVLVEVDLANRQAVVRVRDTGIGIAPELLPHIFETFIQGEQSIDRRQGGLGLGLPLVKGIVELHGGRVKAESAGPRCGTVITISLPLGQEPKSAAKTAVPIIPRARSLRILIVEDNPDAARTLAKLLERYGHKVTIAHTGPAGVEAAQKGRPEVVLCDLGLPDMDGHEVARCLRGDPSTADIRLIAVSGYGEEEARRRSEEAGFDLHLTKPVDPVELQRLLAVLKVGL
jgi:PAS domain S-box-containing protein